MTATSTPDAILFGFELGVSRLFFEYVAAGWQYESALQSAIKRMIFGERMRISIHGPDKGRRLTEEVKPILHGESRCLVEYGAPALYIGRYVSH